MLNPFKQPELIKADVFMRMPDTFRKKQRTAWSDANRQGAEVDSFLEGPSFDCTGNLYFVDIPFGRIFCITTAGKWELVAQYNGWPNGLKIHRDGRLFIADYKNGLMVLDPRKGQVEPLLETMHSEGWKGLNDLHFASNGDLYFTDQGQTGIVDPTGRVFKLHAATGRLERLAQNVPSPNGITLNVQETQVLVAITRSQQIWRLPLMADGSVSKTGVAIQLSGGHAGPDGIEMDAEDGLVVCHLGVGIWRFDANCLPTHLVYADGHRLMTNVAFGGPERKTLYITDSLNGDILQAEMPVAGKTMFAHM
jgi:gluconolactonase